MHRGCFTPQRIVTYFPGLVKQSLIQEKVHFIKSNLQIDIESVSNIVKDIPKNTNEPTTMNGVDITQFGTTTDAPLERIAYTRSGDKGGNSNVGIFVHSNERYDWSRNYMTASVFCDLLGKDL